MTVSPPRQHPFGPVPVSEQTVRALRGVLSPGQISIDAVSNAAYARDAFPLAIKAAADGKSGPPVVVWPETTRDVVAIVNVARASGVALVPYGGGSGIVGAALDPVQGVVMDMKRMRTVIGVDLVSQTVTVQPGILGDRLEILLNAQGLTTGHYPQSLRSSTVGGWVAHRGVGTFSTKYGKVDDLVVSMEVVLPNGEILRTRTVPQSAAGPDLNRLFLGSEGALGVITETTLRVYRLPTARAKLALAFPALDDALTWIRTVVQRGAAPAACRIYDTAEAGIAFPELLLRDPQVLAIAVAEGDERTVEAARVGLLEEAHALGADAVDARVVDLWLQRRFNTASFVRTLMAHDGVVDALEVANEWSRLADTYRGMKSAMEQAAGPRARVYGHASHFYHTGANLYLIFHAFAEPSTALAERYEAVLGAAFDACHAAGGTLTHHHGVGRSKGRWMIDELGPAGFRLLASVKAALDPTGFMNPGTLGLETAIVP